MNRLVVSALLVSAAFATLTGCAVDAGPEGDIASNVGNESAQPGDPGVAGEGEENVGEAKSELFRLKDELYCLPGEKVVCTGIPAPVCRCVPTTPPIIWW